MSEISIYFFGDSICFGQFVSPHRTWVAKVGENLENHFSSLEILIQLTAYNGETTRQALNRLDYCVTSHAPSFVWVQYGLNDANYWKSEKGRPRVALPEFEENLYEIISRCLRSGSKRVFVPTNFPVSKQISHLSANAYLENVLRYNQAIRDSLPSRFDERLAVIDLEAQFCDKRPAEYLLADGVHLSQDGHSLFADFVTPVFIKHLLEVLDK